MNLSLLGVNQWADADDLSAFYKIAYPSADELPDVRQACEKGWQNGCLDKLSLNGKGVYRLAVLEPNHGHLTPATFLTVKTDDFFEIDLRRIPLEDLENICKTCNLHVSQKKLVAQPDLVRISYASKQMSSSPTLIWLQKHHRRFGQIVATIKKKEGKTVVHDNLLIAYLKRHHPFFLISDKIPFKKSEYTPDRYHNFHEAKPDKRWTRLRIPENSKDRFERVEGRFVERFLEGIPLALGYVDVAYSDEKDTVYPSIDKLQAFRITDRGALALSQAIKQPDITLLPNYEIHMDSLFYPARRLNRLLGLCEVVREDTHTVLKLSKNKVIEQHAADTGLNVIDLFKELGIRAIPPNVKQELVAWAGHADNFVVYHGFGLLEGKMDQDTADRFAAVSIAADTHIVREPQKLFNRLEQAQIVPAYVKHSDWAFRSLGDTAQSRFAAQKRTQKKGPRKKRRFTLKRSVHLILEFPDKAMFEAFTVALLDKGYALDTNKQTRTVSYSQKDETIIKDVLNSLKKNFPAVIKNA